MEEPKNVLDALLDSGDLYSAMQLARATKLRLSSKTQVQRFFDAAVASARVRGEFLLFTVTVYANLAHSLTRSP